MSYIADKTIKYMIEANIIPSNDIFDINEDIIRMYCDIFQKIKGSTYEKKPNQERFHKKMAGIILSKELNKRLKSQPCQTIKAINTTLSNSSKSGFIYLISNPVFEGYYKIGMTTDLNSRLNVYQTGDPLRRYRYERTFFVIDRKKTERKVLDKFSVNIKYGEWIKDDKVLDIFHHLVES